MSEVTSLKFEIFLYHCTYEMTKNLTRYKLKTIMLNYYYEFSLYFQGIRKCAKRNQNPCKNVWLQELIEQVLNPILTTRI